MKKQILMMAAAVMAASCMAGGCGKKSSECGADLRRGTES